jgi:hypothetical protein
METLRWLTPSVPDRWTARRHGLALAELRSFAPLRWFESIAETVLCSGACQGGCRQKAVLAWPCRSRASRCAEIARRICQKCRSRRGITGTLPGVPNLKFAIVGEPQIRDTSSLFSVDFWGRILVLDYERNETHCVSTLVSPYVLYRETVDELHRCAAQAATLA